MQAEPAVERPPGRGVDLRGAVRPLLVVLALHVVGFGVLFTVVVPRHFAVGDQVFGVGLALTAYVLGLRHAFDADHIAAIDNTTRKLVGDRRPAAGVGLFFSLGHSAVVFALTVVLAVAATAAATLLSDGTPANRTLGVVGTSVSGLFLLTLAAVNLAALLGMARVWRRLRRGALDEPALERALQSRGLLARVLRPVMARIRRPGQMFVVGLLFGLGFDTATEVALLVLAGTGATTGLPWYAVLTLPVVFAAGMSLADTLDGAFMQAAYGWAAHRPVRKIYYNLTTTGLSVAVALLVGGIELVSLLHEQLGWHDPVTGWIAGLDLGAVGYLVVGLFAVVFGASAAYWRWGGVERRVSGRLGSDGA
ncbi:HoxN/HupN/NixA family nickel/cobalt transporter [Nakamurella endophytica]|uniref:Nickel/cobalt efflux system n=1 Tax=Nakamurella endophytica TaxID=1748367 RepID=A0A917SNN2_9ACTN|nr:HoxN/HupN/NixA family nickel/cobalt transporter [Nakamurella endophytica]GGL89908.1 nickel/cobalt efflux system [Nakamurella endophytica]